MSATRPLPAIIEDAYTLFASYAVGSSLAVCKVCCVTDADEQELLRTPLRQVSAAVLEAGYFTSARAGTAQERHELKHFLPRLLELVTAFEFPVHSDELAFRCLDLGCTSEWPLPERILLQEFALAFFEQCLNQYPLRTGVSLVELLIMFDLGQFELSALLAAWAAASSQSSALHLKDLLLHEIRFKHTSQLALENPFAEKRLAAEMENWLRQPEIQQQLLKQLEHYIMQDSTLDDARMSELSWAYEVLRAIQL
jgi:hypothetical protein